MSRRALSATRAADLLSFLAAHPDRGFTYSELAKRLQVLKKPEKAEPPPGVQATLRDYQLAGSGQ